MTYSIYCMKDRRTSWLQPTLNQNDASAVRDFRISTDKMMDIHKPDFSLYKMGTFNTETGKYELELIPIFICGADDKIDVI